MYKIFLLLLCFHTYAATNMLLKGRTIELKDTLKLSSNSIIQGPGQINIGKKSEGIIIDGSNIKIINISFNANKNYDIPHDSVLKLTEDAEDVLISRNNFSGARYMILKADINTKEDKLLKFKKRARNITFNNNNCYGKFSRHLYISSVEDLLIESNYFKDSVRDSIRLRQNVKNVKIISNTFKDIGIISKESSDAIDTYWSGEELIISNNSFDKIATNGLDIKGLSPDKEGKSSKVIISNNQFSNIQYSGILLSSGAVIPDKENFIGDILITSNQFRHINLDDKDRNYGAIFLRHGVRDTIINSNIINAEKSKGIVIGSFEENAKQTSHIMVHNNIVKSKYAPIHIRASKNISVINNNLKGRDVTLTKKYKKYENSKILIEGNL